jgi:hypothetical protein
MLTSLLEDLVRRRLWPIPLAAVLVAVVAPLLFLKSGADPATPPSPAPAAAPGGLPAGAKGLLTTKERKDHSRSRARDPFEPPAAHRAAAGGAAARTPAAAPSERASAPGRRTIDDAGAPDAGPQPRRSAPQRPAPAQRGSARLAAVDVRYGKRVASSRMHRAVPRLSVFAAGGDAVAVFVKYSPRRRKAVFAVVPDAIVTGPSRCRRKGGVCRYVDIASGSYARVTVRRADGGSLVRRLDVRIRMTSSRSRSASAASARRTVRSGRCVARRLLASLPGSPPVAARCR